MIVFWLTVHVETGSKLFTLNKQNYAPSTCWVFSIYFQKSTVMSELTRFCCLLFISHLLSVQAADNSQDYITCAYYKGTIEHVTEENTLEDPGAQDEAVVTENSRKCFDNSYCYTLWQQDAQNRSVILGQGKRFTSKCPKQIVWFICPFISSADLLNKYAKWCYSYQALLSCLEVRCLIIRAQQTRCCSKNTCLV